MAQRTQVILVDDITGETVEDGTGETIRFSINGEEFEIDLADKQAKKFHDALSFYVDHARKVGGRRSSGRRASSTGKQRDYDPKEVRLWAETNGVEVPSRGRIPADVVVQFREAGN